MKLSRCRKIEKRFTKGMIEYGFGTKTRDYL